MDKGMGTKEVILQTDVSREEMGITGRIQKTKNINPDLTKEGISGKACLEIETGDQKVGTGIEQGQDKYRKTPTRSDSRDRGRNRQENSNCIRCGDSHLSIECRKYPYYKGAPCETCNLTTNTGTVMIQYIRLNCNQKVPGTMKSKIYFALQKNN